MLTRSQRELLDDKVDVWRAQTKVGRDEWRDYHRRCVEALEAALRIVDAATNSEATP